MERRCMEPWLHPWVKRHVSGTGWTVRKTIIFQTIHPSDMIQAQFCQPSWPVHDWARSKDKIRIIQRAGGCSLLQMVLAWIAVKELNLLQRLTSSTGAGEEQALRTQEEKATQYGKVPAARCASETVKQLPVGFLEGGQEKQRCGKRESSSCRCPTGRQRQPARGDTIWSFVHFASCLAGIKDRRKPVCEIMPVTEQHHPVSGLFHRVGLIHLLSA